MSAPDGCHRDRKDTNEDCAECNHPRVHNERHPVPDSPGLIRIPAETPQWHGQPRPTADDIFPTFAPPAGDLTSQTTRSAADSSPETPFANSSEARTEPSNFADQIDPHTRVPRGTGYEAKKEKNWVTRPENDGLVNYKRDTSPEAEVLAGILGRFTVKILQSAVRQVMSITDAKCERCEWRLEAGLVRWLYARRQFIIPGCPFVAEEDDNNNNNNMDSWWD
jgi:hypothetical protein